MKTETKIKEEIPLPMFLHNTQWKVNQMFVTNLQTFLKLLNGNLNISDNFKFEYDYDTNISNLVMVTFSKG